MGNIHQAIENLGEPAKSISSALIEFYQTMKALETDEHRGGKQATKIIMTTRDIEDICKQHPPF